MEEGLNHEQGQGFNPSTDGETHAEVVKKTASMEEDGLNHERVNQITEKAGETHAEVVMASEAAKTSWVKIRVTGYDTSLPDRYISKAVYDHFKSCGQISSIAVRKTSCVFICINGDGGEDKALQLNGSNLRGCNLSVQVVSRTKPNTELTPKQLAIITELEYDKTFWFGIGIMRYQIMQSERLLKESLRQDFASCGVITNVITPRNSRGGPCCDNTNFIYFDGEEAVNKALKLGPSLGLIVHALPKMTENSYSTMVLPHCVQIANGIRKRQMEGNLSLSGLMED